MKLIVIILFFLPPFLVAQNNIDSLELVFKTTKLDSVKINTSFDLAYMYVDKNYQKAGF